MHVTLYAVITRILTIIRTIKLENDAFGEPPFPVVVMSGVADEVLDASLPFFVGLAVATLAEVLLLEWSSASALQ